MPALRGRSRSTLLAVLCHLGLAATALAAAACGGSAVQNDDPPGTGGGGQGGEGGNGAGGQGEGGYVQPTCTLAPTGDGACGATCAFDVTVRCDEGAFAQAGLRVAPAPGTTYLSAGSNDASYLFQLDPSGGTSVTDFPLLPIGTSATLSLDATGALHAAADLSEFGDGEYPGGLTYARTTDAGYQTEVVYDSDQRFTPPYDFDVDNLSGLPHVWFATYDEIGTRGDAHGLRAADGSWSIGDANPVGEYQRFVLDASGQPVSIGFVEAGAGGAMIAFGPEYRQLGSPLDGYFAPIRLTQGPAPTLPPGAAPFVSLVHDVTGLRLAWPTGDTWDERVLPGTEPPAYTCAMNVSPDPNDPECPTDCHETSKGLDFQAFSITRSADGQVWVAYAITTYDIVYGYNLDCAEGYCWCNPYPTADASTSELFLVSVPLDGAPVVTYLDVPLPRLGSDQFHQGMWEDKRILDLRAFGSSLALGVRLEDESGFHVRALRMEMYGPD